jgi:hydrogenase maturation factor
MRNETIAKGKTMNIEIKLEKCGHKETIISHQMYVKTNVVFVYGSGFPLCVSVNVKMNI